MAEFDPYHRWLQIPANEQPANHYRLLGLVLYESDPDVIENAANQRLAHLRTFQSGPNGPMSQQIMNEVTQAKLALLVAEQKAAYDAQLKGEIEARAAAEAAAANPFSQLNVGGNSGPSKTKIQIPGAAVPVAPGQPSSNIGAPTANVTNAPLPSVVNRRVKKRPAWVVPAAIAGVLLLLGVGGSVAMFMLPKSDADKTDTAKVASSDPDTSVAAAPANGTTSNDTGKKGNDDTSANATHEAGFELLGTVRPDSLHSGQMEVTEDGLVLKQNPGINVVAIPVALPKEYDLHATVTKSVGSLLFRVVIDGHPVHLLIDSHATEIKTGLVAIDGKGPQDDDYSGNYHVGTVLKTDERVELKISVRENSMKLFSGDKEIVSWSGDLKSAGPHRYHDLVEPYRFCPGISTWRNSQSTIHSLRLVPLGEATSDKEWLTKATVPPPVETRAAPVDLLALHSDNLDKKFVIKAPVSIESNGINIGKAKSEFSGLFFPQELPAEYDLDMQVTNGGEQTLIISPVIAGRRAVVDIDGYPPNGKQTWLGGLDGKRGGGERSEGHYLGELMPQGKSVPLRISVRKHGVRVSGLVDGELREVYRWIGLVDRIKTIKRLRNFPDEMKNYLGLMTFRSDILIEKLSLVPVTTTIEKTSTQLLADLGMHAPQDLSLDDVDGIDLIGEVDPEANVLSGRITISDDGGIRYSNDPAHHRIVYPVVVPQEYDVHAIVAGNGLKLSVPMNGEPKSLAFHVWNENVASNFATGISMIDKVDMWNGNYPHDSLFDHRISDETPIRIAIKVRRNQLVVEMDGREVYNWSGDVSRVGTIWSTFPVERYRNCLTTQVHRPADCKVLALKLVPHGVPESPQEWLAKARVAPPKETVGEPVDLIASFDQKQVSHEPVVADGDTLTIGSSKQSLAGIAFPVDLPAEYNISMDVVDEAAGSLLAVLNIGGKQAALDLDGRDGTMTGLYSISGNQRGDERHDGWHLGELFPQGERRSVLIEVRREGIRAKVDGKTVYRWVGTQNPLGLGDLADEITISKEKFGLFNHDARFKISKLTLQEVVTEDTPDSADILARISRGMQGAATAPTGQNDGRPKTQVVPSPPEDELARGKPIKMLPQLEFPDNVRMGLVTAERGSLQLVSTDAINLVDFPVLLPREYDVEARVKRVSQDDSFCFGFHVDGNPCILQIDAHPDRGSFTGLSQINGGRVADDSHAVKGVQLPIGVERNLKLSVRSNSVELFIDRNSVYRWTGDASTLSLPVSIRSAPELVYNLSVASNRSQFLVEYVNLTPLGKAAGDRDWLKKSTYGVFKEKGGKPVDLLKKFDASKTLRAPVLADNRGLVIGDNNTVAAGLEIPQELPADFDLSMEVTNGGSNSIGIGFPFGNHRTMLEIDGASSSKRKTLLVRINNRTYGFRAHPGFFAGGAMLPPKTRVPVVLMVRRNGVRVQLAKKYIYQWYGDPDQTITPDWEAKPAADSKNLWLTTWKSPMLISRLAFRPVEVQGYLTPEEVQAKLLEINPDITKQAPEAHPFESNPAEFTRSPRSEDTRTEMKPDTPLIGDNDSTTGVATLKMRELNATEKAEMKEIDKAVRAVARALDAREIKKASPIIANAISIATYEETKQKATALQVLKQDFATFWDTVSKTCGTLKAGHEIELNNGVALVVESSAERIVLRYNGQSIRKAPNELQTGLAMKIVDSVFTEPNAALQQTRGSVYFVDSIRNRENREKAAQWWSDAKKSGQDIGPLMMLLAE